MAGSKLFGSTGYTAIPGLFQQKTECADLGFVPI